MQTMTEVKHNIRTFPGAAHYQYLLSLLGWGGGTGGRQGENWTEGRGRHLVAQMVKNPPAEREIRVRSLDWEDPLEEGMATHSRILA